MSLIGFGYVGENAVGLPEAPARAPRYSPVHGDPALLPVLADYLEFNPRSLSGVLETGKSFGERLRETQRQKFGQAFAHGFLLGEPEGLYPGFVYRGKPPVLVQGLVAHRGLVEEFLEARLGFFQPGYVGPGAGYLATLVPGDAHLGVHPEVGAVLFAKTEILRDGFILEKVFLACQHSVFIFRVQVLLPPAGPEDFFRSIACYSRGVAADPIRQQPVPLALQGEKHHRVYVHYVGQLAGGVLQRRLRHAALFLGGDRVQRQGNVGFYLVEQFYFVLGEEKLVF